MAYPQKWRKIKSSLGLLITPENRITKKIKYYYLFKFKMGRKLGWALRILGKKEKKFLPKFNRAILFDTTQNSWHGLPEPVCSPENEYRKSLAVYYLCTPPKNISKRGKALFAPTQNQESDKTVLKLIKERSSTSQAKRTYRN